MRDAHRADPRTPSAPSDRGRSVPRLGTRASAAIVLALALFASGCLSTAPSVVRTGAPLEARAHVEHVDAYVSRDFEYVDEHDDFVFDGHFQGGERVDELDFYALAGDAAAVEAIADFRAAQNRAMAATWIVTLVSIAASTVGALVYGTSGNEEPDSLSLGLMTGGGLGIAFGLAIVPALFAPSESLDEHGFLLDHDRAEAAAERYNARGGP